MSTSNKYTAITQMEKNAARAEAMLKSLANGKRLMILCHLMQAEHTVSELIEITNLSQSALSQHLAKMRESNLIEPDKRGQMVYYRIANPEVHAILSTLYLIYCRD